MTDPNTTSIVDKLDSYSVSEVDGVVTEVRTTIAPSRSGKPTTRTGIATWALAHASVPSGSITVGSTTLPLSRRNVVVRNGAVEVDVVWSLTQASGTIVPVEPTLADPIVTLGFDTGTVQTNKDRTGAVIEVTFGDRTKGAIVDKIVPLLRKTVEYVAATATPTSTIQAFAGKANDASWTGGAAGTWLCEGGDVTLEDSSVSPAKYRFRFSFVYNADGWNPDAVYIDDETGQPPDNLETVTPPLGVVEVDLYEQVSFAAFPTT